MDLLPCRTTDLALVKENLQESISLSDLDGADITPVELFTSKLSIALSFAQESGIHPVIDAVQTAYDYQDNCSVEIAIQTIDSLLSTVQ